jgi:hypothetical protein
MSHLTFPSLAVSILCLLSLNPSLAAQSNKTCLAVQVAKISYGSEMHNEVFCDKAAFQTKSNITSVIFPIPYKWGKKADAILDKTMSDRGMKRTQSLKLSGINSTEKMKVALFEKESGSTSYCIIRKFDQKTVGLKNDRIIQNALLYCTQDGREAAYQGVTDAELEIAVAQKGSFKKVLDAKLQAGGFDGTISLYRAN